MHIPVHNRIDDFGMNSPEVLTSIIAKLSRKIESGNGGGPSKRPILFAIE
jgi:hypothetical protein